MSLKSSSIRVIESSPMVEKLLEPYRDVIGDDYAGYRGHIYRVLSYTLHFLNGDETHRDAIELALVFHDIALWTDKELAYLEDSATHAQHINETQNLGIEPQLLHDMIYYHHKITPYRGPHQEVINAFRKADWIDATKGILAKGMPRMHIRKVKAAIPAAGFYETLMRLGPELTNNRFFKMIRKFMRVYKL